MRADETHCEHGTYIGYPGGADYLCGWCEDAISVADMIADHNAREYNRMRDEANTFDALYNALFVLPNNMSPDDRDRTWVHVLETYRER